MGSKPVIERTLGSVATLFAQHVAGYVGFSVERRGKNAEQAAVWSMAGLQALLDEWIVAGFSDRSDSENRLDLVLCVADMSATVADALWGGGSGRLGGAAVRLDAVVAEDAAQAIEFAVQLLVFGDDGLDVCVPVGS